MALLPLALALAATQAGAAPAGAGRVDFAREVRPLLARHCFACHGNDEGTREAGLRLDRRDDALRSRGSYAAVVPGDPAASELWLRVTDEVDRMPPSGAGPPLEADEIELLRRWIQEGAPYAEHWSFDAPVRPPLPDVPDPAWVRSPIDAFVAARLTAEGLAPSPEADRATLLRRASLDLIGLPPSASEAQAFLADESPDAYERAVDRLLASPHYGERWASLWLDLARYADSAGHGSDPLRTIWRYRDWVIEAFDRNMPFDEFSLHQLAGDLLPDADRDSRLATAFHRNTMTNTEGGTDNEEFRVLAVKDRVNTTGQVWLGLTVGCAECHSHKFDPLSQREYYQLFDYFNQTADADEDDDRPRMPAPTAAQRTEYSVLQDAREALAERLAGRSQAVSEAERRRYLEGIAAADAAWRPATITAFRFAGSGDRSGFDIAHISRSRISRFLWPVERETARLELTSPVERPTAIRFRAPGFLDGSQPGFGPNGNFVVTSFRLSRLPALSDEPTSVMARRIRVELPGRERILSLAEVEVLAGDENVAARGTAKQSSVAFDGAAARAIDGDTSGAYDAGGVTHTATEDDPWWELDLGASVAVESVRVWNRTDGELEARLHGFRVLFLDDDGEAVFATAPAPAPLPSTALGPALPMPIALTAGSASFEQRDFPLADAVAPIADPKRGWAVAPYTKAGHEAVLVLPELPPAHGPATFELTIEQGFGGKHVVMDYDVAVTDAAEVPTAVADEVRAAADARAAPPSPEVDALIAYRLAHSDPERDLLEAQLARIDAALARLGVVSTPVMVELARESRRPTHVLFKGNFLAPGERVSAATPAALHPSAERYARNRLGLARWLFDDANPLTARVTANRLWARLFGRGIVATEDDFGVQGELPTHHELLDWLAVELRESGWDQKALLREIVLSSTYRQASAVTPELRLRDPSGELLSRYPRQRLEAELVRDTLLSAAGLLSPKKLGPSVFPPQPDGIWQAAFNGERTWAESKGEDRWRRGLYVFVRRTAPYPMLATFDAPSREVCTARRPRTNTPLQAMVTLNDPVFVEAAQALGRLLASESAAHGDAAAIALASWRTTSRAPSEELEAALTALLDEAGRAFAAAPDEAASFALGPHGSLGPLGPLPDGLAASEAAAWTLVASTVLNLDATLTKE